MALLHSWGALHIGYGINEKEIPEWYELESVFTTNFLAFLMFNRGFYKVWDAWVKKPGSDFGSMMIIFDGHACRGGKNWAIQTSRDVATPVQDFVDEQDGKAPIILLLCCNPRNEGRVTSKKSLVIYSRGQLSSLSMQSKRTRQVMHIPGYGDFVGTTQEERLNEIAAEIASGT